MTFLLDTNVVSEMARRKPDPVIVAWFKGVAEDDIYLSVVTLAELRFGVARLTEGEQRTRLETWLHEQMLTRFASRLIDIDAKIAEAWADLTASRFAEGRPIAVMDGFLAATARVKGLILVTRNVKDFVGSAPKIVNPWFSEDK